MANSIWLKASPVRVARALEGHSALALAVAGLIYILCISGALLVFNHELQRWEQPGAPELTTLSPEATARAAAAALIADDAPTSHLFVQMPTPDLPRVVVTTDNRAFFADADGALAGAEAHPWTQFVLDLHYYLHLPSTLGLTVVGALGVMLLGLSITGFLAHPRIFRDAFTFRKGAGRLTGADLHNRLSVWTAPFHISSALTGAMLGLASILGFAIAAQNFDGDIGAVFDPIFGEEPSPDERPAPLAAIERPLAYMAAEYPDIAVNYVVIHDPETAGQHVSVIGLHERRLIFGEYYNFDATGAFTGTAGLADGTVGQQIAAATYQVHFGSFGGFPVKAAYVLFGLTLSVIAASGMSVYFARRREQGRAAPRLESTWAGVVWGAPAALALTMTGSVTGAVPAAGLVPLFWLTVTATLLGGFWAGNRSAVAKALRVAGGVALLCGTATHALVNMSDFSSPAAYGVSGAFLLLAAAALAHPLRAALARRPEPKEAEAFVPPAQ